MNLFGKKLDHSCLTRNDEGNGKLFRLPHSAESQRAIALLPV
jgi:hypothetical protein